MILLFLVANKYLPAWHSEVWVGNLEFTALVKIKFCLSSLLRLKVIMG